MRVEPSSRVAVVTGASRGIGQHIARRLGLGGVRVGRVARNAAALRRVESELRAGGAVCEALPADCPRPEEVERLKRDVEHLLGPPSILVNAAGTFGPLQPVRDGDAAAWIATL